MAWDEVAAVLAVCRLDGCEEVVAGAVERLLELAQPRLQAREVVLELEDLPDTDEAHAFVGELLDAPQQRDVAIGVATVAALRALRLDEALALVDAQRLRVHTRELGCHRDDVERPVVLRRHVTPPGAHAGWW